MILALHAGHSPQHTHIEAIRAGQHGYIEIGTIAGDPDDIRHKRYIQRWFYLTGDNITELLQLIGQLAATYGNVYSSRVLYHQPRRDKAQALPTRLLFLDDAPPGSYTYTVETSPQRMQAYILLDELISPDQAEHFGRRLAYQQGADQGGWDITQLVRVPGTRNTKAQAGGQYDDRRHWIPGTGHQITLTRRTERAYTVAEISEATQTVAPLPIDALDASSVAMWHGNIADLLTPDGLPRRWKNPQTVGWKVLRGEIHTKSSSEARYHIITSLVLHGYPDDEIAALGIHLTNFGKMETKGSDWLYHDIARCTRKARADLAAQGKIITINPTLLGRTRAPAKLPRQSPARRGRKCKGSPATYLTRLLNEASSDQVHWTLGQAAAEMHVSVATIKRWEAVLKTERKIERLTVASREHSYVAILGQLKIHESAQNQAPLEVSSQIEVQSVLTPSNDDVPCNTKENHRGASQPPAAFPVAMAPSFAPAVRPLDDQAEDLASASGVAFEPLADDQAKAADANFVPLADDQADEVPARVELVCGDELRGPAGAFVVVAGAAYVPSGAEPWYAAICAAIAPPPGEQADDQAEVMQFVASLDADDLAEPAQPPSVTVPAAKTSRTAPKWVRELHAYMKRLDRMSGSQLAGELRKWHNTECKRGKAPWITDRIGAVEREIERRDLLGGPTSGQNDAPGRSRGADDQAANASTEPPPTLEQAAPSPGVVRRVWRSPFVPFDTPTGTLPPREVVPRTHPIAELGTNPESMRAAHEYCQAVLARLGESAF